MVGFGKDAQGAQLPEKGRNREVHGSAQAGRPKVRLPELKHGPARKRDPEAVQEVNTPCKVKIKQFNKDG